MVRGGGGIYANHEREVVNALDFVFACGSEVKKDKADALTECKSAPHATVALSASLPALHNTHTYILATSTWRC